MPVDQNIKYIPLDMPWAYAFDNVLQRRYNYHDDNDMTLMISVIILQLPITWTSSGLYNVTQYCHINSSCLVQSNGSIKTSSTSTSINL